MLFRSHEMTHSTGAENQLGRLKPTSFGSKEYAREELVAELSAALVAQRYGMTKNLKEDSASYLKSWLSSLKESPEFIKTTLVDVKKASGMITKCIDDIQMKIDNGQNLGNNNIELSAKETETTGVNKVEDLEIASKYLPKPEEEIERPRWHR